MRDKRCACRKLLARHFNENTLAVVVLRGGNRLLLLMPQQLELHILVGLGLRRERVVIENAKFQAMTADSRLHFVTLLTADALYVYEVENMQKICYVAVGTKDEVLALKWSPDSAKIGILSDCDTLTLVDVQSGQLLWTLDLKLRYFVDISVVNNEIYAMGNKFMLSRFRDSKELDTHNVHQEGISLKASSTLLLSTQEVHFVCSSNGNVVRMDPHNPDAATLVNCIDTSSVTALQHDRNCDQLFVGFEDGKVVCFDVMSKADGEPVDETADCDDYIFCSLAQVQRYESEVNNLSVQCNLIRDQSERILNDYKTGKEREIADLRGELEASILAMRAKMKRAEEKYEAIEASKEEAFAHMRQEMDDTLAEQKSQYEKMVDDQIKSAIKKEQKQADELKDMEAQFTTTITQLKNVFKREEKTWRKREKTSQHEIEKLAADLKLAQAHGHHLERRIVDAKQQLVEQLATQQKLFDSQSADDVYQIKQLKAYLLREREAKEAADALTAEIRTDLASKREEAEKLRSEIELSNISLQERDKRTDDTSRQFDKLRRDHDVLNQKQILLRKELDDEKQLRHTHQRRLQHFEMLVDELAGHVYAPRRLERNVLNLLAFFNSVPRSGHMQTNAQINSTEKKTGVTKRVMHLGTSRNKAH